MKLRYILVSLALHLCLMLLTLNQTEIRPEEPTTVELVSGTGEKQGGEDTQIAEMDDFGEKPAVLSYWGLGIYGMYEVFGGEYVYLVNSVVPGYNGQKSGIQDGDRIVLVNGLSVRDEEISGQGPKKLSLMILRVDKISGMSYSIKIETERCKVYQ